MQKMRKYLIIASAALVLGACNKKASNGGDESKPGYKVTGKINNLSEGKIYLDELGEAQFISRDTAEIKADGTFVLEGNVPEPGIYKLGLNNQDMILFVLDNKEIQIEATAPDMAKNYTVKGSEDSERIKDLNSIMIGTDSRLKELNQRYITASTTGDQAAMKAIEKEFYTIQEENQKSLKKFIRENPNSVVAAYATTYLINPEQEFAFTDSMNNVFQKTLPDSKYTKALSAKIQKTGGTAIGVTAPEIKLPSPDGQEIALSSLRGKYVLIDFWASWCGPCRKENPNVVRMYNKYKDKGFEIFGVSFDQNKDKWVQAIAADKLTWPHVSDLKGWESSAAQLYGITSIPHTILLDKEGKIIAKNLRGEALEQKLAEVLK